MIPQPMLNLFFPFVPCQNHEVISCPKPFLGQRKKLWESPFTHCSGREMKWLLGEYTRYDLGVFDAREALIKPEVSISEAFVVDTQAVKDGGVQVIHVNRVFYYVVGKVIGLAILKTCFDTTSGHPHREAAAMVIATVVVFGQFAL